MHQSSNRSYPLQDATPITVGQEISGWKSTLEHDVMTLNAIKQSLLELPIGGTAVGTGLNTKNGFDQDVVDTINNNENTNYKVAENKFHGLADHSEITSVHGIFKTLASDLIKIGNDIRFFLPDHVLDTTNYQFQATNRDLQSCPVRSTPLKSKH
ncbi:Fumarate hydratase class II [Apilactobacillus kunkeei]|nr:Fumarate hydratase class II [Apilactobacillus kunkeei]